MKALALLLLFPFAVSAAECPVDSSDPDKIVAALEAAKTCSEAAEVARSCAWGSSIDVNFTAIAGARCFEDFKSIEQKAREGFEHLIDQCNKKYENEEGTLYRSAAAFCRLKVAEAFSSAYGPIEE